METYRQRYIATTRRPFFQTALNISDDMQTVIEASAIFAPDDRTQVLQLLDDYRNLGAQLLDLDVRLNGKLHDLICRRRRLILITDELLSMRRAQYGRPILGSPGSAWLPSGSAGGFHIFPRCPRC